MARILLTGAIITIPCVMRKLMNHFIFADPVKCIGCNTCMAACSLAHEQQGLLSRPRLEVMRHGNGTAPVSCRHCEDMPCAKVCPVNAITATGHSVHINESNCIGCKLCGLACPFGAITPAADRPAGHPEVYEHYVPEEELADAPGSNYSMPPFLAWNVGRRTVAVKCDLCYFRSSPACVEACPTMALRLVDEKTLAELQNSKRVATLEMEKHDDKAVPAATTMSGVQHA